MTYAALFFLFLLLFVFVFDFDFIFIVLIVIIFIYFIFRLHGRVGDMSICIAMPAVLGALTSFVRLDSLRDVPSPPLIVFALGGRRNAGSSFLSYLPHKPMRVRSRRISFSSIIRRREKLVEQQPHVIAHAVVRSPITVPCNRQNSASQAIGDRGGQAFSRGIVPSPSSTARRHVRQARNERQRVAFARASPSIIAIVGGTA
jgi:hypothetical protein